MTLLLLSKVFLNGQNEIVSIDEKALIRNTIETYFEGWMTGDTSKLGEAMHQTCQLKNVKEDKVLIFDRATYLGFFKPRSRRVNSGGRIIDINVTGNIASAKCNIETPERLYTDYFNMMKLGGQWYIVDKIATSKLKTADGFYINWNIDRTQKKVKPSLPISAEEAKTVNCYYVKFDDENRMTSVKYFLSGKPSNDSNYGAFELQRSYNDNRMEDRFKNTEGKETATSSGKGLNKYHLNNNGFWILKEHFDLKGNRIESDGVASVELTRNHKDEVESWTRLDLKKDTVEFYNKLKKTYIIVDDYGQIAFMQNRKENGNLINGPMGVAEVAYNYDDNGSQLSKEFRNENSKPIMHPTLFYSRLEFRDFNKYGFPKRQFKFDEKGHYMESAEIEYNPNMTRKTITYYDKKGNLTENAYGFANSIYLYNDLGELIKEKRYNLAGQAIN